MVHHRLFTEFTGPTTTSGPEGPAGSRRETQASATLIRLRDLILPTSLLGCWIWTGRVNDDGRPVLSVPGRGDVTVARLIWEEMRGPIPDGHEIDHLCRNIRCPSPHHLEPVTPSENRRRALEPQHQTARFAQRLAELMAEYGGRA